MSPRPAAGRTIFACPTSCCSPRNGSASTSAPISRGRRIWRSKSTTPGDESYEKLPFYAALGIPEIWIIHRDTKEPEIYLLRRGRYRKQRPLASGWLRSPGTGIEMRVGAPGKLAVRLTGKEATREDLPLA